MKDLIYIFKNKDIIIINKFIIKKDITLNQNNFVNFAGK